MKFNILSLLLVFSSAVFSSEPCKDENGTAENIVKFVEGSNCPNKKKLKNICMTVGSRMADQDGKNKFLYTTRILDAACVTASDSQQVATEKIRKTWLMYEKDLKCNSTTFDVIDGSILKYAVANEFDAFLDDALKWKVNLNKVDETDGRTLLDYLQYHIDRNKNNMMGQKYQIYYLKFKQAGAKHKVDL